MHLCSCDFYWHCQSGIFEDSICLKMNNLKCNDNSTSLILSSPYSHSNSGLKLDSSKESFEIYGLAEPGTFLTRALFHAL